MISPLLRSANYYHFANTPEGNDITGDGSIVTPWETITKANALHPVGDDSIVFKAGDTFIGTLNLTHSGTSGHPIIYGKYGIGANPIITGFTTLSSWTNEGGSIYSKTVSLASSDYIIVSVDGVNTGIGRYPNAGATWLTIDSHTAKTAITDAAIPKATQDWTGADIAVRTNQWTIERRTITNHTANTITYAALIYAPTDNWGYFIQNHLKTLDAANEWFYDGDFHIYGDPAAKTVKVSAYVNAIVINGYSYITIDNLNIIGYGYDGIALTSSPYITVQNCSISFCGGSGIAGNESTSSPGCSFNNNIIDQCNDNGIYLYYDYTTPTISNNAISNCGLISGAAYTGYRFYAYSGMFIYKGTNAVIEYNTVTNSGYCGMHVSGVGYTVRYNFVQNFCMTKQDGGGIYTTSTGSTWKNNIVLDGIGNVEGVYGSSIAQAHGLYTDNTAMTNTLDSNVVSRCTDNYFSNNNQNGTVTNNIFYDGKKEVVCLTTTLKPDGCDGLVMQYNQIIAKASSITCLYFISTTTLDPTADFDYNYYTRPINDGATIVTLPGWVYRTLAQWQVYSGVDANSAKSPVTPVDTTEIDFYYNFTNHDSIVTLPYASIELDGTKHAVNYTVPQYYGVVLLKDPDPDPLAPDQPTVTTTVPTNIFTTTATSGGNVTDDGGGTVSDRGVCWALTPDPTIADDHVHNGIGTGAFTSYLTGLTPNTVYYVRAFATNEVATSYGTNMEFFTTITYRILHHGNKVLFHGDKVLYIK